MAKNSKTKTSFKLPPAILDIVAFAILGLLVGLVGFSNRSTSTFNETLELSLYIPFFISTIVGFIFYIFVEYKYNHLKLKNILLYLGAIIALLNILAVALLPSQITILDKTLVITPLKRAEYLLCGIPFGLLPFGYFYLLPRKILNRHHLSIALMLLLGFVLCTITVSPILDWKHMINGEPIGSFLFSKTNFGLILATGIFVSITLRIQTKKWWWILFIIPIYIFLILTRAKVSLVVGTLAILIYLIIRLVRICKKSKDNLVIVLSIVGLCLLLLTLFIVGVIKSESGILGAIHNYFVKAIDSAKQTIATRILLWQSTLKLVSSYRVIFGYGACSFGPVLNLLYSQIAPEWDRHISSAHNGAMEILGKGGIILLLIWVALYVYLIRITIKMRKKNYWLSISTLIFIGLSLLISTFEWTSLGLSNEIFPNLVIVLPIMSEYYMFMDKDEKEIRKNIVDNVETIKNKQYKSKLLTLNKKRLILDAKYIVKDINS